LRFNYSPETQEQELQRTPMSFDIWGKKVSGQMENIQKPINISDQA
jgi:hypothetical protein